MAVSAASIIAMAGDTIRMNENATLMIHRAWGLMMGNSADMKDYAETLNRLDGQLAGTYAARTGLRKDTVTKLMIGESDGTSFDAAEAKAKGFADEIVPNKKKAKDAADKAVAENESRNGGPAASFKAIPAVATLMVANREQLAARERESRARKLRLMEIDGHASQTPTG